MGLFSSTETTKIDKTTTPIVPDWALQPAGDAFGRVREIGQQDPSQFVQGADPLQTMAGGQAAGLGGNPAWGEAIGAVRDTLARGPASAAAASASDSLSKYFNPYTDQVVNTSLASFDADADRQRTQQGLGLAGRRAGSGSELAMSLLGGELGRERGMLEAGLRGQGWQSAAGLADSDAARAQEANLFNASSANNFTGQVGSSLAGILGMMGGDTRANIGTQLDTGGTLRDIATEQSNAPLNLAGWQIDRMGQLAPYAQLATGEHTVGTEKTTGSPSLMGKIGQGIGIAANAASLFSDRRLKRDVVQVGELADGLGVYAYRYLWSPVRHIGVMAQDALRLRPWAVRRHASGFLMVDYARL